MGITTMAAFPFFSWRIFCLLQSKFVAFKYLWYRKKFLFNIFSFFWSKLKQLRLWNFDLVYLQIQFIKIYGKFNRINKLFLYLEINYTKRNNLCLKHFCWTWIFPWKKCRKKIVQKSWCTKTSKNREEENNFKRGEFKSAKPQQLKFVTSIQHF